MYKAKILLVDDEPDILRAVGARLESNGYNVITASNGSDAIDKALQEKPDLAILDINMPHGNGHEVAAHLRESMSIHYMPIIFLSACTSKEDIEMAAETGVDEYIIKPFQPADLLRAIESLLAKQRTA